MKNKLIITATFALATFVLGGCASTPWGNGSASTSPAASEIESQKAELARREEALAQQQLQLEAERARLTDARNKMEPAAMQASGTGTRYGLTPLDPKPGECYARVIIPAKYETTVELKVKREAYEEFKIIPAHYEIVEDEVEVKQEANRLEVIEAQYETVPEPVMIKPPKTKLEIVPAVYEVVKERVVVKAESTKLEVIPAQYKTVQEPVMIEPPKTKLEVFPAVFETRREQMEDQPARKVWMLGTSIGIGSGIALASATQTIERYGDYKILETRIEDTGDLMCLVEIPATYRPWDTEVVVKKAQALPNPKEKIPADYETIEQQVLTAPARTREVTIPAEYRMVEVEREIRPETTREITIPAEYINVMVTKEIRPETTREFDIPAEYINVSVTKEISPETAQAVVIPEMKDTVTHTTKISDEKVEWRPVLCEVNMTRENVIALQSALNATDSCQCGANGNACQVDGLIGDCTLKGVERYAKQKGLSWGSNYVTLDVIRTLGLNFGTDEGDLEN